MKKEMLENGEILTELVKDFLVNKTEENLKTLFSIIRDSDVFISAEMEFSEADKKRFMEAKPGDNIVPQDKVNIKPGFIKTKDGKVYFPVFTKEEFIPEERKKAGALPLRMPFLQCAKMALNAEKTEAILVNPFMDNFVLNKKNLEIISKLPSSLEK